MRKKGEGGYSTLDFAGDNKPKHLCKVKRCTNLRCKGKTVCHTHKMIAWRSTNPLQAAYATLRDHAIRRRITFTITIKQFEELVIPSGYLERKGNHSDDLHIDRIDPLVGYIQGNLQVITCRENCIKGATTDKSKLSKERERIERQQAHLAANLQDEDNIQF